ncbi:MAG: DUF2442 domain-containing protein [bacterium]|nr:DUF2442 domain-containing protein [bacterium]
MNGIKEKYPRIESVALLNDYNLRVTFTNHVIKNYDCTSLLQEPEFLILRDPIIFRMVRVDRGGYGISWNDEIDVSESELWLHGKTVSFSQQTPPQNNNIPHSPKFHER